MSSKLSRAQRMHEDHDIVQQTKRKRAIEEDSHFSSPSASSKSSKRSGLLIVPDMVVTPGAGRAQPAAGGRPGPAPAEAAHLIGLCERSRHAAGGLQLPLQGCSVRVLGRHSRHSSDSAECCIAESRILVDSKSISTCSSSISARPLPQPSPRRAP
jgi:hypothetical protein